MDNCTQKTALMVMGAITILTASPAWAQDGHGDHMLQQTFAPFSQLLDAFLVEKPLAQGGLVSAFDYRMKAGQGGYGTTTIVFRGLSSILMISPECLW